MNGTVKIFDNEFEYDFLSAWIKYNRLLKNYSQESICYGICSPSHLSYFENGKKKLNASIIEALLNNLGIHSIESIDHNISSIRKNLINFITELEFRNYEHAQNIFIDLLQYENLILNSPYIIEFKIYKLAYEAYILKLDFNILEKDIKSINTIFSSLDENLQYIFLVVTGRLYYKYLTHEEGIALLEKAKSIKDTPWVNYHLGFCYCYDNQPLKAIMTMSKALDSYHQLGQYVCAMYCNIYLGICYTDAKMYSESYSHLLAAFNAASNFEINSVLTQSSFHISSMFLQLEDYESAIDWAKKSASGDFAIRSACNCIESYEALNMPEKYSQIFSEYLLDSNKDSIYYNLLYFTYLRTHHIDEEIFLDETINNIIPYYSKINYSNICDKIYEKLILYYESKRHYKDANKLYKKLLKI